MGGLLLKLYSVVVLCAIVRFLNYTKLLFLLVHIWPDITSLWINEHSIDFYLHFKDFLSVSGDVWMEETSGATFLWYRCWRVWLWGGVYIVKQFLFLIEQCFFLFFKLLYVPNVWGRLAYIFPCYFYPAIVQSQIPQLDGVCHCLLVNVYVLPKKIYMLSVTSG